MARKFPRKEWAEQVIVVKKSHPFAKTKESAKSIADRHVKDGLKEVRETSGSFRVVRRPKTCFFSFRSQKRGDHVTVVWGRLKENARRSSACR